MKCLCDICTATMKLTRTHTPALAQFSVRTYNCPICGYVRAVDDNGYFDNKRNPREAVADSRKVFRREEIARL